jgi:hypothetical protein
MLDAKSRAASSSELTKQACASCIATERWYYSYYSAADIPFNNLRQDSNRVPMRLPRYGTLRGDSIGGVADDSSAWNTIGSIRF